MKCPACGATLKKISRKCTECGARIKKSEDGSLAQVTEPAEAVPTAETVPATEAVPTVSVMSTDATRSTPSLITFPGVNRNALPEWRKELSERVRVKQERRTREAQLENGDAATAPVEVGPQTIPPLELLRQAEAQPVNPILQAALQRIERAHSQSFGHSNAAVATAAFCEEEQSFVAHAPADNPAAEVAEEARPAEKTHNLAVVPKPAPVEETPKIVGRPRRLIGESNDPALDYLDTIPTALLVERCNFIAASPVRRVVAAIIDLAIVFVWSLPLLMLNPVTTLESQNWRAVAFSMGSFLLVGFFYLTIVTAFTGRTLGMRLCSLRVIDARNGLIPTGSQSAGRAIIYLISLASVVLSLYLLLDSERQTLHDRFTRTAVIRA